MLTSESAVMQSLSRHGSSWDIYTAYLYCAASGETVERDKKEKKNRCKSIPVEVATCYDVVTSRTQLPHEEEKRFRP